MGKRETDGQIESEGGLDRESSKLMIVVSFLMFIIMKVIVLRILLLCVACNVPLIFSVGNLLFLGNRITGQPRLLSLCWVESSSIKSWL